MGQGNIYHGVHGGTRLREKASARQAEEKKEEKRVDLIPGLTSEIKSTTCKGRGRGCLGGLLPDNNVASNPGLRSNVGFDVTSGFCILCVLGHSSAGARVVRRKMFATSSVAEMTKRGEGKRG